MAGWIFSTLWLACMLAPLSGGQVADRWVPTQLFLAAAHLVGGVALFVLGLRADHGAASFVPWLALMGAYALLYAPTLALTNSLAFRHLASEKEFGLVRVGGTVGWIASGLLLTAWRRGFLGPPAESRCDCILLAAG